jgi:hypothetical protein
VFGCGLIFSSLNFAALLGDIVFGAPGVFLGGLEILYAVTGHSLRWPFGLTRSTSRNDRQRIRRDFVN